METQTNANPFEATKDMSSTEAFDLDLEAMVDDEKYSKYHCPPGKYDAKVVDLEGKHSQKGNPMWVFTVALMDGPKAGLELRYHCVVPQAQFRIAQAFDAIGEDVVPKLSEAKEVFNNRRLQVVLEDDEFNGQVRSSIKELLPHPDGSLDDTHIPF